jgi:microcystin-dependent protein
MGPFLGEIRLFPYGYVPAGWAACDGSMVQINRNQALFSLLGTMFGGDGITTFALPDLRGKAPFDAQGGYCIAIEGMYPSRG